MAAITWTDVLNHAPELSTVDTDAQNDILAHVNTALDVAVFGGESSAKTKLARIYLAAHFGATAKAGGAGGGVGVAGPVIREKAGGLEREYSDATSGSGSDARANLNSTTYGQLYLELVNTSKARGPMVL